jgi:hypothetical protein
MEPFLSSATVFATLNTIQSLKSEPYEQFEVHEMTQNSIIVIETIIFMDI